MWPFQQQTKVNVMTACGRYERAAGVKDMIETIHSHGGNSSTSAFVFCIYTLSHASLLYNIQEDQFFVKIILVENGKFMSHLV